MSLFTELNEILSALRNTARSIFVFLIMVMLVVIVFACIMYVIEGANSGFESIPMSIYWAVVTITTVATAISCTDTGWAFCRRFRNAGRIQHYRSAHAAHHASWKKSTRDKDRRRRTNVRSVRDKA